VKYCYVSGLSIIKQSEEVIEFMERRSTSKFYLLEPLRVYKVKELIKENGYLKMWM
jgi:hypothetical protein